jgi:hypothetical protein
MPRHALQLEGNKSSCSLLEKKKHWEDVMDQITRCPKCGKQTIPVVTICGRTDLQCISCDDPAVKWAESPLTAPEKPIVAERSPALGTSEADEGSMTRGLK